MPVIITTTSIRIVSLAASDNCGCSDSVWIVDVVNIIGLCSFKIDTTLPLCFFFLSHVTNNRSQNFRICGFCTHSLSFPATQTLARKGSILLTKITFSNINLLAYTENGIHSLDLRKCMEIRNLIATAVSTGRLRHPQDGSCRLTEEFDSRVTI